VNVSLALIVENYLVDFKAQTSRLVQTNRSKFPLHFEERFYILGVSHHFPPPIQENPMRNQTFILFIVLAFFAASVQAQEKEKPKEAAPAMVPPQPLSDDFSDWMIGEWEGTTTSIMGTSKDWQKVEWGLDKQFLMTNYTSKTLGMTEEQKKKAAEMWGMSLEDIEKMTQMTYKGMGPMTMNPATGEYVGYWFDNWRGVYTGKGRREGNKVAITWEGPMGTEVRTTEKVSDDKMVVTFKSTDPKGNVMEGKTELTRKKAAGKM
jgi:hypothetical protein